MIKRTESNQPSSKRRKSTKKVSRRKRRMQMEGLEPRQLLAGGGLTNVPLPNPVVPTFAGARNIGAVQATPFTESELSNQLGVNDTRFSADVVPLGTGPGQDDTIDVTGSVSFEIRNPAVTLADGTILPATFDADIDTFAVDLRAGDILDIATLGSVSNFTVQYDNGAIWWGVDDNQPSQLYPPASPLMTLGNAVFAQVVPEDGRYYITVAPDTVQGTYTLGLRAYRPVVEQLPIGSQQVLFLDFDGAIFPSSVISDSTGIPQPGIIRYEPLQSSLQGIGLDPRDDVAFNRLVDVMLAKVEQHFAYLGANGNAGDFDTTGVPGDFGVTILNSRDHADPGNNPLVTRVIIGDDGTNIGGNLGVSTTIDVGNFEMNDLVFVATDGHLIDGTTVPLSNTVSPLEATAENLAFTVSHEAGHSFGLRHTDSASTIASLIDAGGNIASDLGVGNDGIFGTLDDEDVNFVDDIFAPEGIFGTNRVTNGLANTLVTGTIGGSITGRVFHDFNRDGDGISDVGLVGVTVFADFNGDGLLTTGEPTSITDADGNFTLSGASGSTNIVAIAPSLFAPTTPISQAVTFALGSSASGIDFGFSQVNSTVTGTKFSDDNGNGIRDDGEGGLEGVYIYLDLDGDDRPDLGEPAGITKSDGTYTIDFPGPGTYTVREVVEAGFEQTFPASGEHQITFDGFTLSDNADFGNRPARDFGDAPLSYGSAGHGLVPGLYLGVVPPDRESSSNFSDNALGDDSNGSLALDGTVIDDEDGLQIIGPLAPGATTNVEISAENSTGTAAFLNAWVDFNADGDFDDAGEQVANDQQLVTGTVTFPVAVPSTAVLGETFVRLRYSHTPGLTPVGNADTGEVEDHVITINESTDIANSDFFTVSRNTQANQLDVLANDFQTAGNQLTIENNVVGALGTVVVAADGKSLFYTPPNGFIGRDTFSYNVVDQFNRRNEEPILVEVNVSFQTANPIAIDDSFFVPEGSNNRALNVLDNDIASLAGGLTITSTTPGSNGGTISITGGSQSIRYTPLPGFNGTEQFDYSVQDANGSVSTATVTVNLLPGSQADDVVDFHIEVLDSVNQQPIESIRVGESFDVRISVEDLRLNALPEGVASAFLDLLYSDALVAVSNTGVNPEFQFDVVFGELFSGVNSVDLNGTPLQGGSAAIPGLINEIGGLQTSIPSVSFDGRRELATITMQAVSPGVASFQGDPADSIFSETIVVQGRDPLPVNQLRFGSAELVIFPNSDVFTSAIDDSYPDGRNELDQLISSAQPVRLDVLANDILGGNGNITEFGLITSATLGNAVINDNNTPNVFNDDFIEYIANVSANGLEEFTYLIVTDDGVRSRGTVTIPVGAAADDDLVSLSFALVNEAGQAISTVNVGDRFGVQVIAEDLRDAPTFVFGAYLDMMYGAGLIRPTDTIVTDNLNFDADFNDGISAPDIDFNVDTAVGTAARPGIIDEFGSFLTQVTANNEPGTNPNLVATVFFEAIATGTTSVVGGPADSFPFQDTLLGASGVPVPVSQIRYDVLDITIGSQAEFIQNANNPFDVNDDGNVTPSDALSIINDFSNEQQARGEGPLVSKLYYDVNGDGKRTPGDALAVITELEESRRRAVRAEQVTSDTLATSSSDDDDSVAADSVFADLHNRQLVTDASGSENAQAASLELVDPTSDDADDDDVLNLLADDLSGLGE